MDSEPKIKKKDPLCAINMPSPEQVLGKAEKGNSMISGPTLSFYLLSQTKQAWGVDFGSGDWPAAYSSVNEIKILSRWGEEGISNTNNHQKGLYYGQKDQGW